MPLLGGIFGKKNKSSARSINNGPSSGNTNVSTSELDSGAPSPTASYVTTEKSLPSSPNGQSYLHPDAAHHKSNHVYPSFAHANSSASSSKLRLPFGRKKSKPPVSDSTHSPSTSPSANFMTPPRPSYTERLSIASDSDSSVRHLRPPPSKSAIFAAYADPNSALSTRSLPNEHIPSYSPMQVPPLPVPPKEKRPSLFNWAKSTPSGKLPSEPKPSMNLDSPPRLEADSSFNLKSFRHVKPPSPDSSSLAVPPARPRGASVNSDSSQRISVAAFREVQARRSAAGSPVPSIGSASPSLVPPPLPQDGQRGRASPRLPPAARSSPHLSNVDQRRRSSSMAFGYTSESDEETTSSEEESDDDAQGSRDIHRDETITRKTRPLIGKRQAKSEVGHGRGGSSAIQPPTFLTTRSHHGHGQADSSTRQSSYVMDTQTSPVEVPLRSQSSMERARPRASASTSALAPSAAAKRASVLASANAALNQDPLATVKQTTRHVRDSSTYSNPSQPMKKPVDPDTSDSDSDDDDAPLASLVPPRRPGSSMSNGSNTSLRTNGTRGPPRGMSKPLIDISEITSKKPPVGAHKGGDDEGFTKGGLLAGQGANSKQEPIFVASPVSTGFPSPTMDGVVTSKTPPGFTHFSAPTSPPKELEAYFSLDNTFANVSPTPLNRSERDHSPETKRDALTERLAKVAKLKGKERESMDGSSKSQPLNPSPPQPTSPRSTFVQPDSPPQRTVGSTKPVLPPLRSSKPSPPDAELIHDVDDSILRLISQMGGEPSESSESDSDQYNEPEVKRGKEPELPRQPSPEKDRIAPIPIKQRTPQPSFSVMSRPPIQKLQSDESINTNQNTNARFNASSGRSSTVLTDTSPTPNPIPLTRPRSSTLMPSSTSPPTPYGASTSSFAKLNSRGGPIVAPSVGGYSNSSTSSTNFYTPITETATNFGPSSAATDRANALRNVGALKTDLGQGSAAGSPSSPGSRPRSSTMLTLLPSQSQSKMATAPVPGMPIRPFAGRRDSPASSTGGSSNGPAPLTPRDGSDIGVSGGPSPRTRDSGGKKREEWSSGVSGLGTASTKSGGGRQVKRRSVSFDDDVKDEGMLGTGLGGRKSKEVLSDDTEARRRERRRGEAKAAIELGNVINGPGPIVSDDEDDLPINQAMNARISVVNPMMPMGNMGNALQVPFASPSGAPGAWGGNMSMWQQQRTSQMLSPQQYMLPPPPDANLVAAHQQAMMYAKQAYQMAVAQQAMAAASDEWDRNSVIGGSVYGGPTSNAPVMMGPSPYGMMGMGGMGNPWSTGSVIFPNNSPQMYGGRGAISSSRSEFGGAPGRGGGGGNWNSARSTYGESFGPSDRLRSSGGGNRSSGGMRDSGYYPPMPPMPPNQSGVSSAPAASKGRGRTASQPASPRPAVRKTPPPSSWKADR